LRGLATSVICTYFRLEFLLYRAQLDAQAKEIGLQPTLADFFGADKRHAARRQNTRFLTAAFAAPGSLYHRRNRLGEIRRWR
jgi:hypothetical protein